MEAIAKARYLKISPFKVRPVINQVRGLTVEDALARLASSPRKAARLAEKTISSAAANLKGKGKVEESSILIKRIQADGGPLVPPFKYRPRARGMANRIRNRTCHITVVVEEGAGPSGRREEAVSSRRKKKQK
ncbi:MAG: 50S ribosomal protein L22 [Candidatus Erginobacter occultus]|nr:50S ribosomal protein L22 [Candidatus Erginobacter occultus]